MVMFELLVMGEIAWAGPVIDDTDQTWRGATDAALSQPPGRGTDRTGQPTDSTVKKSVLSGATPSAFCRTMILSRCSSMYCLLVVVAAGSLAGVEFTPMQYRLGEKAQQVRPSMIHPAESRPR